MFNIIQTPGPGKNLFDPRKKQASGSYSFADLEQEDGSYLIPNPGTFGYWATNGYIPFNGKPNTAYTISYDLVIPEGSGATAISLGFVYAVNPDTHKPSDGEAGNRIRPTEYTHVSFSSSSSKTVIGLAVWYGTGDPSQFKNIQVEEGSSATAYEPYQQYKFYGDIVVPFVPSEYDCVKYLDSNGTQYIDTGIKSLTYIKSNVERINSTGWSTIFGADDRSAKNTYCFAEVDSSNRIVVSSSSGGITPSGSIDAPVNTPVLVEKQLSKVTLDASVTLFARNYGANVAKATFRIYDFLAKDGDTVLCDMVPVKKKSNNEYGMYDRVTGTFFGNAGTGVFAAGPVVDRDSHFMLKGGN